MSSDASYWNRCSLQFEPPVVLKNELLGMTSQQLVQFRAQAVHVQAEGFPRKVDYLPLHQGRSRHDIPSLIESQ